MKVNSLQDAPEDAPHNAWMTKEATPPPTMDTTYVHLRDDRSAALVEVTPTFWESLMRDERPELDEGRLVMQFSFTEDWRSWEMHPKGDEIVLLISGSVTLVLERDGAEVAHRLDAPGAYVLVPRGVWHTARTTAPCTMLFVTPGEGTEHRPT